MSSTNARDGGLRRISVITRWVAALGVTGTALLAAVVYKATPGRATTTSVPATSSAGVADPNATIAPDPGTGDPGFQAPAVAPAPVYQAPVVRSGGS